MAVCEVCGNDYDKAFSVTQAGKTMTFDSFECAIHAMAPRCAQCQCHVIGHGVKSGGVISSLVSDNSRDENQLAKIVAAEAAGLKLLADLVASLRNGNYQGREETALSEVIAA